ncbi:PREDICTED: rab effector Noc2 isoform X1 [Rhinopithecus bieti]|uniref:rab effector Noc2 isoform X1 n=1 Tax=Rhinopithecus bieti TaxID=61621 RepID=UPI00083BBFCD|nr:PREDICTED: rab effector Noc2 isoform X1 [Rhinopithecus bieti]XP_017718312.1 PREDICTED: rab effector Noc2 isoform X1 [Rhinopithecus bieti]XP_017718387.1 PREDICTED: rab effector Noc2 isoform X1 [Rhinopithecus bieti]XP_017718465.1 PREDICTED: rab effector Noc2 isoform X1 [Rhinopithecus bieti]XP_017718534.1 PREDICTED: rab effector Noc2 isoform X1 [Rhinopithecus bieti]XP_017718596.1 PREDICTED: rab effector Noc2 isoform X1 [Rhinopithecus bieti]XP_017718677.1 PREDICTED: rab effector Noc2 isoform X
MADTIFGSGNDQWVCPNDRQLALRAKLQTGWSVHTYQTEKQRRNQHLSPAEVEAILQVIQRAERLDVLEQHRIGRLVERLETMRRNVLGNGLSQCLLCGEVLGFLGSSSVFCKDCRKVWKRSGAWFYKGLPKYILPLKTPGRADDPHVRPVPLEPAEREPRSSETGRIYTWARGRVVSSDSDSDSDLSSSSLEDRLPPSGVRGLKGDKPWRESASETERVASKAPSDVDIPELTLWDLLYEKELTGALRLVQRRPGRGKERHFPVLQTHEGLLGKGLQSVTPQVAVWRPPGWGSRTHWATSPGARAAWPVRWGQALPTRSGGPYPRPT